jgi:ankyrin repeat protein
VFSCKRTSVSFQRSAISYQMAARSNLVLCLIFTACVPAGANDGSTPLLLAVHNDDVESASKLIRSGSNVNAANDLGVTPLWAASENGNEELVRRLLEAGANPNAALLKGETPLMVAARSGAAGVVKMLLDKGANPNARAARDQTALMWAVSQRHAAVVRLLLAGGADVHARSATWSQMMAVPPHGHPGYNRMIPHGADTAILFAARAGDLESAKLLVAAGANVNDQDAAGISATALAAHAGHRDVVAFLLSKDADANKNGAGFTALHAAVMHSDEAMVAALLAHGADVNAEVKTWTPTRRSSRDFHFPPALIGARPLWLAARFSTPAILSLLIKTGADARFVHRADYLTDDLEPKKEAITILMAATGIGTGRAWAPPRGNRETQMLEAVKLIVPLGVDVNAKNTDGRTALSAAKALGFEKVVRYLEEQGAR